MGTFPITAYDRPGLALGNLLAGEPGSALTAALDPERLGPDKLERKFLEGLRKTAGDNPYLRGIMSVATDPMVVLGLFLSSKYPVVAAKKLFDVGAKYAGYFHTPGIFEGLFGRAARIFAGTNIPELMQMTAERRSEFLTKWGKRAANILEEYRERTGSLPNIQVQARVMAKLQGLDRPEGMWGLGLGKMKEGLLADTIQLGPHEHRMYEQFGKYYEDFYKEVVQPLRQSPATKRRFAAMMAARGLDPRQWDLENLGPRAFYAPQVLVRNPQMVQDWLLGMRQFAVESAAEFRAKETAAMSGHTSMHALIRIGTSMPDLDQLSLVGPLNPRTLAALEARVAGIAGNHANRIVSLLKGPLTRAIPPEEHRVASLVQVAANELRDLGIPVENVVVREKLADAVQKLQAGEVVAARQSVGDVIRGALKDRKYTLELAKATESYFNSFSQPYVWSITKLGEKARKMPGLHAQMRLGDAFKTEVGVLASPESRNMMETDYIPIMQGHLTPDQVTSALRWNSVKLRALQWLRDPTGVSRYLPKSWTAWIRDSILGEKGGVSYLGAHAKLANWFYLGALGFNPASAFQNLLQPLISTIPLTNVGPFWKGVESATKKSSRYFGLRARGVAGGPAMAEAFPEFVKAGLDPDPLTHSMLREALDATWSDVQRLPLTTAGSSKHWEAFKRAALFMFSKSEKWNRVVSFEAGMAKAAADGLTGDDALSFAAKVVRATQFPAGPLEMPRVLLRLPAAWRQFLYFPLRYAGFLAESTLYGGENKRNWGTLGRTMLSSALIHRLASEGLGVDLSRSLMLGALPFPSMKDSAFFPLPMVPPALGVAGTAISALATGDTDQLGQALALTVPGGVAARRAYRTLSPHYADYERRDPDGRIPVYNEQGSRIGSYTPMQLFMRAVGLKPTDVTGEQNLMRYLLKQRDRIREYRRQYIEAVAGGNPDQAQRVQDEFHREYPSLGPISVKPSELKALEDRRMMSRLERALRTIPKEYRPQFAGLVNTAIAGHVGNQMAGPEPLSMLEGLEGGDIGGPAFSASSMPRFDQAFGFGP